MVQKTSILVGENPVACAEDLLSKSLIKSYQDLSTNHPNTARILVVVRGNENDYEKTIDQIVDLAAQRKIAWRHENYATYGDPALQQWTPQPPPMS
jgi:hypothetical protein